MKHIHHIARPIRNPALIRVLTLQDESRQLRPVNPVQPPDHGQTAHHPPTIANVHQLLRPPIQSAAGQLPLAEPRAEAVFALLAEMGVELASDCESANAGEDLAGVGFCTGRYAKRAVEVLAGFDVGGGGGDVDEGTFVGSLMWHVAEEGEGVEGAEEESGVDLAPFVAGEAAVGLLMSGYVLCDFALDVWYAPLERVKPVNHGEDLNRIAGVEDVRIVAGRRAEASIVMQTAEDVVEQAFSREGVGLAEEVERRQAPVYAADAQVFGEVVFELISALLHASVSAM